MTAPALLTIAPDRIAVSVKTACAMTEVSETFLRTVINKQELPAYRVGRAIRIFVDDLEGWLRTRTRVGSEDDR